MRVAAAVSLLLVIGLSVAYGIYRTQIVANPGKHIKREEILRRIARESPVFYRDRKNKIGVFFSSEHRQYVRYEELPEAFVQAIVSAEDKRFFDHAGVDFRGIARAMIANIKARRVVAGGSTITQQTAKNLYYRSDRSLKAKWTELINALKLEAHYSKEEILEFYVNQFHVHSNGRGIGIAARYFFDKAVKDLSVLECAFLAGVVKAPFRYNPFVGRSEEKRDLAKSRARIRTHYVLDRMHANGYLSTYDLNALEAERLQFKKGEFRYDSNVILDFVYDQLQHERFTEILELHGIDDPAAAGIRVFTTVDREYQLAAEYGLRHHLTDIGAQLEGLDLEAFLDEPANLMPLEQDEMFLHGFYRGQVKKVVTEGDGAPYLEIDLGDIAGVVPKEGLQRVADIVKRSARKQPWARAGRRELARFVEKIPVAKMVQVSASRIDEAGVPYLDLELAPELQGAVVVLDRGRVMAMVGGQDNRNFNRAVDARRQLGSTFKPLTYAAALSLGWGTLTPLDNRRQGFRFQRQWYWPRPDHTGVSPYVSMAQSGFSSENLAAVSLLYHLTDRLNDDQMKDLAHRVGMAPLVGESRNDYVKRIRDMYGILPDGDSWKEGVFEAVKRGLVVDLSFSGRAREMLDLEYLPYGLGFGDEAASTRRNVGSSRERTARLAFLDRGFLRLEALADDAMLDAEILMDAVRWQEARRREHFPSALLGRLLGGGKDRGEVVDAKQIEPAAVEKALKHFYTREDGTEKRLIYARRGALKWGRPTLSEAAWLLTGELGEPVASVAEGAPGSGDSGEEASAGEGGQPGAGDSSGDVAGDGGTAGSGASDGPVIGALTTGKGSKGDDGDVAGESFMERLRRESGLLRDRVEEARERHARKDPAEAILLEDSLSPATVRELREALEQRLEASDKPAKYDLSRLIHNQEFRVMAGLQYVIRMTRAMGVSSPMKPVLPMTLGANDVSLLEAAMMYQTFLEGKAYTFGGEGAEASIIERIEDPSGRVIYQLSSVSHQVLDPSIGVRVGRVLRGVVEHGTGRRAREAVTLTSADPEKAQTLLDAKYVVPLYGKTGTTNDYTNAIFVGFVPTPRRPGPDLPYSEALTVATYVGYDKNRPMRRGSIRAQGASGALPPWIDTVRGIVRDLDLSELLDPESLTPKEVIPIGWPREMVAVSIDKMTGLRAGAGILIPDEALPEGSLSYEVYGYTEGGGWRERESYLPFAAWRRGSARGEGLRP